MYKILIATVISAVFISGCQRLPQQPAATAQQHASSSQRLSANDREPLSQHPAVGRLLKAPDMLLLLQHQHSGEMLLQPLSMRAQMLSYGQPELKVIKILAEGSELKIAAIHGDKVTVVFEQQQAVLGGALAGPKVVDWLVSSADCDALSHCQPWKTEIQRCLAKGQCQSFVQLVPTDASGRAYPRHRPPFKPDWVKATLTPLQTYARQQALQLDTDDTMLEAIVTSDAVAVANLFFHQHQFHLKGDGIYAAD